MTFLSKVFRPSAAPLFNFSNNLPRSILPSVIQLMSPLIPPDRYLSSVAIFSSAGITSAAASTSSYVKSFTLLSNSRRPSAAPLFNFSNNLPRSILPSVIHLMSPLIPPVRYCSSVAIFNNAEIILYAHF